MDDSDSKRECEIASAEVVKNTKTKTVNNTKKETETGTGRRTVFTPAHARIEKAKTVASFEAEMRAAPGDADAIRAFVSSRHPRLWARIAAEQPPQIIAADN